MSDHSQQELHLPYPAGGNEQPLLPARMVNEYQYCPRLAYLEWVQGEWSDSADTVEGRHGHRRVDRKGGQLPEATTAEDAGHYHARSITLSSDRHGLIARMDLIEGDGLNVTPVDYKRGKRPHVARGAYDPERVQLCVQGLILREHGYQCDAGELYFIESRERVRVPFDDELLLLTQNTIDGLRLMAAGGRIPEPLQDSPKCPRCSLCGICLPDETHLLRGTSDSPPRPLSVTRDEALPLHIQAHSAKLAKRGEQLDVFIRDEKVKSVRLIDISQVVIMGNVYITTPCLQALMQLQIPVSWHSFGGWFTGHTVGTGHKNVEVRTAQYRASFQDAHCFAIARGLVDAKIHNCRILLRRNWKGPDKPTDTLAGLQDDLRRVQRARNIEELLGFEGAAAARYFGAFEQMIQNTQNPDESQLRFDFHRRNRRPPTDPVNALLSYAYALLTRAWTVTLSAVGLDPYRGFYHQPRYGTPALALDLMEPFRPLIADSSVIQAINNGEVRPSDFTVVANSVALKEDGRRRFIGCFERRMSHEVTHPLFGYRISMRRLLEVQARLLCRHLLGELPEYPNFKTR